MSDTEGKDSGDTPSDDQAVGPCPPADVSNARLSVIIPSYNRRDFLPEAIASVLSQTWPGAARPGALEIIVADDGSTDGSGEYLAEAARQLPGLLRVLRLAHGGTPGRARNAAVAAARGELIAFLDVDDLWRPEKLARQLPLHLAPAGAAPVLSHTRESWLRGDRLISQKGQRHRREGDVFPDALHKCTIGPSTVIMRRDTFLELRGFREDLEVAEDYELWLRLTHRHPVAYLDEPLTIKRAGHGDQLSEKYGAIEYFRIQALRDLLAARAFAEEAAVAPEGAAESRGHQGLAEEVLAEKCRIYAKGCEKRGRLDEAAQYRALAAFYTPGPAAGAADSGKE